MTVGVLRARARWCDRWQAILLRRDGEEAIGDRATHRLATVPNQLGVDHDAHAIESILRYFAPDLGWR